MRLMYKNRPEPGTIVYHKPEHPDIMQRFYAIDEDGCTLRVANPHTEVYVQAQPFNGHPPRSVIEHYVLRRTWTPYGYAKVWGRTPECAEPQTKRAGTARQRLREISDELQEKQARCRAWHLARHPQPERPTGHAYIKKVNQLYREMRDGDN